MEYQQSRRKTQGGFVSPDIERTLRCTALFMSVYFFFFYVSLSLDFNTPLIFLNKNCVYLRYATWWVGYTYGKIIVTVNLMNISSPHIVTIFCVCNESTWNLLSEQISSAQYSINELVLLSGWKIQSYPSPVCCAPGRGWPGHIHICLLSSKAAGSQPGLPACPLAERFVAQGHMPRELSAVRLPASSLENKILHIKLDLRPGWLFEYS